MKKENEKRILEHLVKWREVKESGRDSVKC